MKTGLFLAATSCMVLASADLSATPIGDNGLANATPNIELVRHGHSGGGHGYYRHGGYHYYNGHRGYSYYRPGYRRYGDWWFPGAAFAAGAVIGGAMAAPGPAYAAPMGGDAHVEWCRNRYRSYRISDDTFQPSRGPRQPCISPY